MKDSGISWIDSIPKQWQIKKISDVVPVVTDYVASGSFASLRENVRYLDEPSYAMLIRTADLSGTKDKKVYIDEQAYKFLSNSNLHGGEVILSNIGSVGNVFQYQPIYPKASLAPNAIMLNGCSCNRFVYYWFLCPLANDELKRIGSHAVQLKFNKTQLKQMPIVWPSEAEQKRIVEHLDCECAKINKLIINQQAQIEKLKQYKQSLITEVVTKGLDPNAPMKDSGVEWIGEISSSFQLMRLKDVAIILDQFRKPITADQRNQEAEVLYDYYGASGAIDKIDGYTIDDHVMLIGEDGANLKMRNLPLMYEVWGKAWINNHAHILKPKAEIDFYYLFYALEGLDINPYITGSAQPKLNQENLKNIFVPIPTIDEQIRISAYIKEKHARIEHIIGIKHRKIELLNSYKQSFIFEYVTGKKEVL